MKVTERLEVVRRNKLCLNCLSAGHQAKSCGKGCCHHCQQKHHSLLHNEQSSPCFKSSVPSPKKPVTPNQQHKQTLPHNQGQYTHNSTMPPSTNALLVAHSSNTQPLSLTQNQPTTNHNTVSLSVSTKNNTGDVLLSTAVICVKDQYGVTRLARALLDSCSQFCFMTTNFSQKLNLNGHSDYLAVQGIGGSKSISRRRVSACVLPRLEKISSYNKHMSFYVLPELTATLPVQRVSIDQRKLPSDIVLADPQFYEPGKIDIIIGAEYFFDILVDGRSNIHAEDPTLQNTVFGWIVSGRISTQSVNIPQAMSFSCTLADIHEQLARFWGIEACKSNSIQSVEESTCETIFDETTTRNSKGKFVVSLPKKHLVLRQLGECENIATKRFLALERRLEANPQLKAQYHQFIHEYEQLGHMKMVDGLTQNFPSIFFRTTQY